MLIAAVALQVVLAIVFLITGGTKLIGMKMHVEAFEKWGYPQELRFMAGFAEITGALGLIIGIWVPFFALLSALWLAATMIGAFYTDFFRGERQKAVVPAVLLVVAIAIVVLLGMGSTA